MKVKNSELPFIMSNLDKLDTTTMDVANIQKVVKLRKELEAHAETSNEIQTKIFKDFGLEADQNGNITWENHADKAKISKKIEDLYKTEVELKNTQTMNSETFYACVKGMKVSEIANLEKLFVNGAE